MQRSQSVKDISEELIKLYAARSNIKSTPFKSYSEETVFGSEFIYDETVDQLKAIEDIDKDLSSEVPMDRLLCGDVGFGKTEVAFRAAFKAILSGKQVAILCPTTLLCRQHYELALERFAGFDVNIAVFVGFSAQPAALQAHIQQPFFEVSPAVINQIIQIIVQIKHCYCTP